jgi:hypothetical protein
MGPLAADCLWNADMINLPNKFSNTGKFENVINKIIDYCKSITPIGSPTVHISGGNSGRIFTAASQTSGGINTGPTVSYYVRSFGDYILCSKLAGIGQTPGVAPYFRIAKTPKMRNSITSETIYSQIYAMSYPHNLVNTDNLYGVYRTSLLTALGQSEYQGIMPQYLPNDKILAWPYSVGDVQIEAADVATSSDVPTLGALVNLIEDNPRMWMAFNTQVAGGT